MLFLEIHTMRRPRLIFLLSLAFLVTGVAWWLWPSAGEKTQDPARPAKVDTRAISPEFLVAAPDANPAGPNPMDGGMMAVRPIKEREKWQASLSLLIVNAETKQPIPGVKVYLQGPIRLPPAWSDTDGNATYLGLPAGMYYYSLVHDVYTTSEESAADVIEIAAEDHKEVLLEMRPSCIATGRLVDARTGKPVWGASVFPNRYEENIPTVSDLLGRFRVATGEYKRANLFIQAKGYAPQERMIGCENGEHDLGDVVLTGAWILVGRVVDEQGEPLWGVTVQDYPERLEEAPPQNIIRVRTDGEGRFEMVGLPTTDEVIFFYKEGYASTTANVSPTTPRDFEVRMFAACMLQGKVTDRSGQPVDGVVVMGLRGGWGQDVTAVTDDNGGFSIVANPGRVELFLLHQTSGGQMRRYVTAECVPDGEPVSFEIDTSGEVLATGVVVDDRDLPISGAMVTARAMESNSDAAFSSRFTTTDEGGQFELAVPEQGKYVLRAFSFQRIMSGRIENLSGEQRNVTIKLVTFSHLGDEPTKGNVFDADGEPISEFIYCWSQCRERLPADEQGQWARRDSWPIDFPPLWIFLPDGRMGRHLLTGAEPTVATVGPGAPLTLEIGSSFGSGLVTVELVAGAVLMREAIEHEIRFPLLPPGRYTIILTAADGRRKDLPDILVRDGETQNLGIIEIDSQE
jgi:hypothetical protein